VSKHSKRIKCMCVSAKTITSSYNYVEKVDVNERFINANVKPSVCENEPQVSWIQIKMLMSLRGLFERENISFGIKAKNFTLEHYFQVRR
jgi:hypothetical protein